MRKEIKEILDDIQYDDFYQQTFESSKEYKILVDELNYAEKCHNLEEQLGCPLEVLFVGIKAVKNGIYAKDLPNENKLKYIPTLTLSNIGTEWYLSNHCDFCVNVRDYKTLYWLKEDKSE